MFASWATLDSPSFHENETLIQINSCSSFHVGIVWIAFVVPRPSSRGRFTQSVLT